MMIGSKKHISFTMLFVGFIFLFNPNINIIDFLPDFIGYIIISAAIVKLGDINESLCEAGRGFRRMIIIDAAKLLALMWIFGMSVTSERNTSVLLWTFVFSVLELIFLLPTLIKFFKGIAELGFFNENTSILGSKKGKSNYTDKIKKFTMIFIVLKTVLMLLPELSDIMNYEYSENYGLNHIYEHLGTMRFLSFIPVVILGIIWVAKLGVYFSRINRDKPFIAALDRIYAERVLTKKGIFVKRAVKLSSIVLLFAVGLTADFRLDGVNLFPDFIAAGLMFVYFLILSKQVNINKPLSYLTAAAYFIATVAHSVMEFIFLEEYGYGAIYRSTEALGFFYAMVAVSTVAAIAFFAMFVSIMLSMCDVIAQHIKGIQVNPEHLEAQRKLVIERKRELRLNIVYLIVAFAIYLAIDAVYPILAGEFVYMFTINLVTALIFLGFTFKTYNDIYDEVENTYMLE